MTECERNVAVFKENLPVKSLKPAFPQFLWIQAPLHEHFDNNYQRLKFNRCLEDIAKLHSNCTSLMLKKALDPQDSSLFIESSQRFTARGFAVYWKAIDKTVCYFNSVLLKNSPVTG